MKGGSGALMVTREGSCPRGLAEPVGWLLILLLLNLPTCWELGSLLPLTGEVRSAAGIT